jgi:lysophospholipase L1-like esterase
MSRTRWFDIGAIAVTIAVLAGLGFALRPQHMPTVTVDPQTAHVDRSQPPAKTRPLALIIGDSYTFGSGLAEMSHGCMAALRLGWLCKLSGGPGTGYISGGPANRFVVNEYIGPSKSFEERLPRLAMMYKPDVVLLDGGRNDVFAGLDAVFDAMSSTLASVRQTWPQARIVFIRPRYLAQPDDDLGFDDDFFARLQAEPAAQDLVVIDPISRFAGTDTSTLLRDGIHPNRAGDLALSAAFFDSLLEQGIGPPA